MKLALAAAAAMVSAVMAVVGPAVAIPITEGFEVTATDGPLIGQIFTGTFTYDSNQIAGFGNEAVFADQGLRVSFTFNGTHYTEADDPDFPHFPAVGFLNGDVLGLVYANAAFAFDFNGLFTYTISGDVFGGIAVYTGPVTVAVSEPELLTLLGVGVLVLGVTMRRQFRTRMGATLATA